MRLDERAVREQRRRERRLRREEPRVADLLHGVAHAQHQRRVREAHDDVPVVRVLRAAPQRPHGRGPAGQGRGGDLGHADAAAEQAERGPGAAAARDGQPRVVLGAARRREDLERRRAAERLGPVQRRQVPQGRGPEGGRDLGRARAVVAEARVEDRARGRVVGAVADAPELEQGVVARLRGRVEQPVARDAQRARREERVEDGHAHVGHAGGAPRERHLVEVPQLALHEEEEEVALAVRRHARRQQPARRREARAPRQRRADLGVALVLEGDPVLAADQHAARAVAAAGRRREHVGRARDGLAPAARHVVEAEVELVVGEHLLGVARRLAARVGVGVAVVELERREARVVEADVERDDVEDDAARLVRLERRADGGRAGGVAVQRVHELRALDRGDHDRAAARVGREVLAGHRAPAARLAERLAVDARPGPPGGVEAQHRQRAGVRRNGDVVRGRARRPHGAERAHAAERRRAGHGREAARGLVGPEQLERAALPRDDHLLRAPGRERAEGRGDDCRRGVQGELHEMHRAQLACSRAPRCSQRSRLQDRGRPGQRARLTSPPSRPLTL